jgi:hypothetical protein
MPKDIKDEEDEEDEREEKLKKALDAATLAKQQLEQELRLELIPSGGRWQQESMKTQFDEDVRAFMKSNPACTLQDPRDLPGTPGGPQMRISGFTPQLRLSMSALFLRQQAKEKRDGQFAVDIGFSDPASAVKNFAAQNVLARIAKLTYKKDGKSETLDPGGIQKLLQKTIGSVIGVTPDEAPDTAPRKKKGKRKASPWDIPLLPKPRPKGEE